MQTTDPIKQIEEQLATMRDELLLLKTHADLLEYNLEKQRLSAILLEVQKIKVNLMVVKTERAGLRFQLREKGHA